MNYLDTFIAVAEDCQADTGLTPPARPGKLSIAQIHYELIHAHPYRYTQEDVLFETYLRHKGIKCSKPDTAQRAAFFAKPQACLRTSPLAKNYGWGLHFDAQGKVAVYAVNSAAYCSHQASAGTVLHAMRSKRG